MTDQFERRDIIQGVGLVAGVAAAASLIDKPAVAQTAPLTGPKPVYQPKPMSFDPKAIKGISEKILVSHYENNYVGAVRRVTAIAAQIADLDYAKAPNFLVNGLKREELIATNSMILHEVYFDSLGGGGQPSGALSDAIKRDFGSMERWRAEFSAMGKAEGGPAKVHQEHVAIFEAIRSRDEVAARQAVCRPTASPWRRAAERQHGQSPSACECWPGSRTRPDSGASVPRSDDGTCRKHPA